MVILSNQNFDQKSNLNLFYLRIATNFSSFNNRNGATLPYYQMVEVVK